MQRVNTLEKMESRDAISLMSLANHRLDFLKTGRLDRATLGWERAVPSATRVAILGSSSVMHLASAIRVAGMRMGLDIETYQAAYGQFAQDLIDPNSGFHGFRPHFVLFALDARGIAAGKEEISTTSESQAHLEDALSRLRHYWSMAQGTGATVIQQTLMPVFPPVLGENEHRLASSNADFVYAFNEAVRRDADRANVHVLSLDRHVMRHGIQGWYNPVLWHRAKQEIAPTAAPFYGNIVVRLLAAIQGRSAKCLVLDLDNTIWGGVVGDDGVDGIILGQGSAQGEAFLGVQAYAKALARRGIILAVCSKNDEANARGAFERHPEMLLKREDIAVFVANWDDKATNLRRIANTLAIGLDSLVLLDDNPFERNLVRQTLPEVSVPELPEDEPEAFADILSLAGYFESVGITDEDRQRTSHYRANVERAALKSETTDLPAYLRSLKMRLQYKTFNELDLPRVVQLINKTNQFNLTTRRVTQSEIAAIGHDPETIALHFRLVDRFGDNGIIAVIIARPLDSRTLVIDTWLMSCRVLRRGVEETMLDVLAERARLRRVERLVGHYIPTSKNNIVANHYETLGFSPVISPPDVAHGEKFYELVLDKYTGPQDSLIEVEDGK
jgi:FkbH-like protein